MSSKVRTPVTIRAPKPRNATLVALMFNWLPSTQPAIISAKIAAVISSFLDIDPIDARSLRAAPGASGVAPTPGGKILKTRNGNIAIATSVGTHEASSQLPNPISNPAFCTIWMPIGLQDVAVIQRAEETARPAIEQNIR